MAKKTNSFGVALVTCPRVQEAEVLARGIVQGRLAACVNLVKAVDSFFWWEGKVDQAQEVLLIIKTQRKRFNRLAEYVRTHHSYQVPEVIFLPIESGHQPYLDWIVESLKTKR